MPKNRRKKKQPNPYDASEATVKQLTVTRADDDAEDNCTCSQCSKSVEQLLECECCEQWYCCACQNVCDKMFAVLHEFKSLHWFCAKCEPTILRRPKDATSLQVNPQGQQCEIESRLKALESQLTSLTNSLSKITKSCSVVDSPQAINVTSHVTAPDVLALRAVDEYRQREQCKLNLIFHKVPESTHSEVSTRREDDLKFIYTLAKELGIEHLEVVNAICLGRPVESRSRLLKVEVCNSQVKRQLLSKAKNLRQCKSDQLRTVFITPDLSPQERQQQKNLRAELHIRRDAGERNIVIRKGQIVSVRAQDMDTTHSSLGTSSVASSAASVSNDQSG